MQFIFRFFQLRYHHFRKAHRPNSLFDSFLSVILFCPQIMFDSISSKNTDSRPAGIHMMLYCFKLARLDFFQGEYLLSWSIDDVDNNNNIGTYWLSQPYYKKMKICCDICFIDTGVVMYLPQLPRLWHKVWTNSMRAFWKYFE